MNKNIRKELRYYKDNKKNLFKNGYKILNENLIINTQDYKFENYLETPIKDFKKKYLNEVVKNDDPQYFEFHTNPENVYKNIKFENILYGDWWRIGDTKKDIMKYVTISTPEIKIMRNKEEQDFEISSIIEEHYHKVFGYEFPYYIPYQFRRVSKDKKNQYYYLEKQFKYKNIKNAKEKIKDWVKNNKNSDFYKYYYNLIMEYNEKVISLKEPIIIKEKINQIPEYYANVILPFFYEKTYIELFKDILNENIKYETEKESIYSSEYFYNKLVMNEEFKDFLSQFIPNLLDKKSNCKRKFKKKRQNKKNALCHRH